jgi:uncharacterized protein (DUF302 family)
MNFEKATSRAIEELKNEGFGILTEIDVTETLKRKLNVDFPKLLSRKKMRGGSLPKAI